MTPIQLAIAWAVRVAMLALLAGLIARRRAPLCWSFLGYVAVVNVCALLVLLWPDRFFTPEFWMVKQALYDVAKLLVAVELAWRAVRAFPGALRVARGWVVVLLVFSTVVIVLGPQVRDQASWWEWQPRAQLAVVWLISLTGLLVYWYRLPMHGWHRAILLGLTPYLVIFSMLADLLRRDGWRMAWWFGTLDSTAYLALTLWWAYAAWRVERVPVEMPAAVVRRLGLDGA